MNKLLKEMLEDAFPQVEESKNGVVITPVSDSYLEVRELIEDCVRRANVVGNIVIRIKV